MATKRTVSSQSTSDVPYTKSNAMKGGDTAVAENAEASAGRLRNTVKPRSWSDM